MSRHFTGDLRQFRPLFPQTISYFETLRWRFIQIHAVFPAEHLVCRDTSLDKNLPLTQFADDLGALSLECLFRDNAVVFRHKLLISCADRYDLVEPFFKLSGI